MEADHNLTLVGDGEGATITRSLTGGGLVEVLGARLELRNVRLEGGQATVRLLTCLHLCRVSPPCGDRQHCPPGM